MATSLDPGCNRSTMLVSKSGDLISTNSIQKKYLKNRKRAFNNLLYFTL
jgi:hypothetical protein